MLVVISVIFPHGESGKCPEIYVVFQKIASGLVDMLDSSPTTRQYADMIKQFLPMVMDAFTSNDPTSAVTSFIGQALGPYLSQVRASQAFIFGIIKVNHYS